MTNTITINGTDYPIKVTYGVFKKYLGYLKDAKVDINDVFAAGVTAVNVLEKTAVDAINAGCKIEQLDKRIERNTLLEALEYDDEAYNTLRKLVNEGIAKFQPDEEDTEPGK